MKNLSVVSVYLQAAAPEDLGGVPNSSAARSDAATE